MSSIVVVGANWGDEGKGRIVDYLAGQAGASIRFQGGNNAGHTVVNDLGTFKLHQVPSGVFNPDCLVVLGPGMVISPEKLTVELEEVKASGVIPKLAISDRATSACRCTRWKTPWKSNAWVTAPTAPPVRASPRLTVIGSRKGDPGGLAETAGRAGRAHPVHAGLETAANEGSLSGLRIHPDRPGDGRLAAGSVRSWLDAVCNVSMPLKALQAEGKTLLFEAQLGAGRDLIYGEYPGSPPPTFPAPTPASVAVCRACARSASSPWPRPSAPPSVPAPC